MAKGENANLLQRRPFVFGALVIFFGLYYYRPEDFIHPLTYIPMAKVAGIIGFGALLVGMMGNSGGRRVPRAVKILWLLLLQMTLCVPTALWPGGAFATVWDKYSKGVVVTMLISIAVVTLMELRKLLWIQLSAVALVTFFSIALRNYNPDGRLAGIQQSILSNPNDLAINIAITFPLGLAFLLQSRGLAKKTMWAAGLAVMCVGVVLTSSRSGLLALIISVMICLWEYGIKGKRRTLVIATALVSLVGFIGAISSSHYRARVESIVVGDVEGSGDKGSREARLELLKKSTMTALTHPLFGVGPGCFPQVDASWHVAHNAYTELAAESGIPALILFLMALGAALKNLATVRKSAEYQQNAELKLLTQAIHAAIMAFITGSFFASTEYNLYGYFMIGYTCVLVNLVSTSTAQEKNNRLELSKSRFAGGRRPQVLWNRS
jgi:O-antigen ligase